MTLTHSTKSSLGIPAPDFSLPGTEGKIYSLFDFKDKKVLVIVFTCNHCPYAQTAKPKLIRLWEQYQDKGVQLVAINPNDDKSYPEDSFEKMKEEKYNYPFPYLRDEAQNTAKAFDAVCTPDIFVYDQTRKLDYHGRLDDKRPGIPEVAANFLLKKKIKPKEAQSPDLEMAIKALILGKKPQAKQKPSLGCSIKWKKSFG